MSTSGSRETRAVTKGDQGFAFMEAHFRKAAHDAHDGAFDVEQADDEHGGDEQHGGDQIQQETYRSYLQGGADPNDDDDDDNGCAKCVHDDVFRGLRRK